MNGWSVSFLKQRMPMLKQADHSNIHLLTLVAIAIVSWTAVTVLHEIIGHGGVCTLVGGDVRAVSTTELYCLNVSGWRYKLVAAAGSTANAIVALFCLALARIISRLPATLYYFLWLFMSTNIFYAGSYMMIGPFTGYGDWAYVIQGVQPELLWRLGMTAVGYVICVVGMRFAALPQWGELLGQDPDERQTRMHLLTRVPFVIALMVNVLAGLFSPLQPRWAMLTSLLAPMVLIWLVNLPNWPRATEPVPAVPLPRNMAWWIAGIVFCLFFIVVLGPGIGSFSGHVLERPR